MLICIKTSTALGDSWSGRCSKYCPAGRTSLFHGGCKLYTRTVRMYIAANAALLWRISSPCYNSLHAKSAAPHICPRQGRASRVFRAEDDTPLRPTACGVFRTRRWLFGQVVGIATVGLIHKLDGVAKDVPSEVVYPGRSSIGG